jgi:acetyltransferase-like isoleucine patch superfamily enzyme
MIASVKYFLRNPFRLIPALLSRLPYFSFVRDTGSYQNKMDFNSWFKQKILNKNGHRSVYWPVHDSSTVYDPQNILIGVDTCPGNMGGCYIQGKGGIVIGDYTQVAPNVVIVSANHDVYDTRNHVCEKVMIGNYCWLGAGAKIMPGVVLGDYCIVAAGAVVAGVPAKLVKQLEPALCVKYEHKKKYHGFIPDHKFKKIKEKFTRL